MSVSKLTAARLTLTGLSLHPVCVLLAANLSAGSGLGLRSGVLGVEMKFASERGVPRHCLPSRCELLGTRVVGGCYVGTLLVCC